LQLYDSAGSASLSEGFGHSNHDSEPLPGFGWDSSRPSSQATDDSQALMHARIARLRGESSLPARADLPASRLADSAVDPMARVLVTEPEVDAARCPGACHPGRILPDSDGTMYEDSLPYSVQMLGFTPSPSGGINYSQPELLTPNIVLSIGPETPGLGWEHVADCCSCRYLIRKSASVHSVLRVLPRAASCLIHTSFF
jgi:hypothetical protein